MKKQITIGIAIGIIVLLGIYLAVSRPNTEEPAVTEVIAPESDVSEFSDPATITGEVWADNWFSLYVDGVLTAEDSVSINTERSFNQETFNFTGTYPMQLAFIVKDFKENNTGLEYIGERNQQMGDGGFIAQFTDTATGKVVGVTDETMKCIAIHIAPLDKTCESQTNPVAGVAPCTFTEIEELLDWQVTDFDDSNWENAIAYSEAAVSPKDGYTEIDWDSGAELIWGDDLEQVNTLLCRMTLTSN